MSLYFRISGARMEIVLTLSILTLMIGLTIIFFRSPFYHRHFSVEAKMAEEAEAAGAQPHDFMRRQENMRPVLEALHNIRGALPAEWRHAGLLSWEDRGDRVVLKIARRSKGSLAGAPGFDVFASDPSVAAPRPMAQSALPTPEGVQMLSEGGAGGPAALAAAVDAPAPQARVAESMGESGGWPALILTWTSEDGGRYIMEWSDGSLTTQQDFGDFMGLVSRIIQERLA